jgi:hypothetical protein
MSGIFGGEIATIFTAHYAGWFFKDSQAGSNHLAF